MNQPQAQNRPQKSLAIMLADGLEEAEFVLPFDLCYRAGIHILLVAVSGKAGEEPNSTGKSQCDQGKGDARQGLIIRGSHQLELCAHIKLADFVESQRDVDAVFLPGGMPGSANLAASPLLQRFLQGYSQSLVAKQRYIAAICAAPPHVLGKSLLRGKAYTCYPGAESILPKALQEQRQKQPVVECENILTASGVGSAHLLASRLIERLVSAEKAQEVMRAVLYA